MNSKKFLLLIASFFVLNIVYSQHLIKGTVYDVKSKETLIGANVIVPSTGKGSMTDFEGFFSLEVSKLPIELEVSFIGFEKKIVTVTSTEKQLKIYLGEDKLLLSEIVIVDSRLTEKQKQSAVTIEAMDVIAIKETPASSFYEGLGALKGVDVTSASLGFKIINTRGFNSTSPVRSLQIIDGVDNQSPGLNFSLGNFLGSSELDLKKAEIIVGANSATYGPNAFNGVISMETKSPFQFPGFSAQLKGGDRSLSEVSFRFAKVHTNSEGEEKLGYKLNFYRMSAQDWVADNYDQAYDSPSLSTNPGGYDAVNIYGDEYYAEWNDIKEYPGLRTFHRRGYKEEDIVDYNTDNYKMNLALHYKPTENSELIYSSNYGSGTTVYQGENRFNLKGLQFFQNRLEYKVNDKFFLRLYETHEDAGKTYDAVATANSLLNYHTDNISWASDYATLWKDYVPQIQNFEGWIPVETLQEDNNGNGIPDILDPGVYQNWLTEMETILDNNQDQLAVFHQLVSDSLNNVVGQQGYAFLEPGTEDFDEAFNAITTQTRYDKEGNLIGGTMFYDKSKLYHAHTEYKFESGKNKFTIGANARIYKPDSDGTIFEDGFVKEFNNRFMYDELGQAINDTVIDWIVTSQGLIADTSISHQFVVDTTIKDLQIVNREYGIYAGIDRDFLSETMKFSATFRMDKNQNFDFLYSPAASIVYTPTENDVLRLSLASAIRNPTLTDQYLNYDVGQAILLGNINGFGYNEYFVAIDSLQEYLAGDNALGTYNPNALRGGLMQVEAIQPEKVKTIEAGYRTTLFEKLYLDISAYYSVYDDFIGYQTGASFKFGSTIVATQQDVLDGWATQVGDTIDNYNDILLPSIQGYRVAANAKDKVSTKGFTLGANYFMSEHLTLNGNYSWNKLNKKGTDDPIIPAYNTPEHKFNLGFNLRDINISTSRNWGASMNFKWVDGYLFEGSPQFTGNIPSYSQLDMQINKKITLVDFIGTDITSNFKIGASNLLNNVSYQVYGGPRVGRLIYLSLQLDM